MNDTAVSWPQGDPEKGPADPTVPWLLFIHHLPQEPAYLRVKVQRRLKELGAQALKASVYVRPNTEDDREDFEWLASEIKSMGGMAIVCEARSFGGAMTDSDVAALLEEPAVPRRVEGYTGRTWVTRQGIKVDRIGSAWLIKRFIDKAATFRFVPGRSHERTPDEVRFDMFGDCEFGHERDDCTFEGMLRWFDLDQGALKALGEIVHDVDLKDGKFGRPEAAGLAAMIAGIARAHPDDDAARLKAGEAVFDTLHLALGGKPA